MYWAVTIYACGYGYGAFRDEDGKICFRQKFLAVQASLSDIGGCGCDAVGRKLNKIDKSRQRHRQKNRPRKLAKKSAKFQFSKIG